MVQKLILLRPDAFDLGNEIGGLMAKIAILPSASIANALLAIFKNDGARFDEAGLLGSQYAVLQELPAVLTVNAVCNAVLVPGGPVDDTQTSLSKAFVADLGETCIVLTLKKVPPFLLCSTGAEVKVLAGANGIESILDAELLNVAGTLLIAVHAESAVSAVSFMLVDGSDISHS